VGACGGGERADAAVAVGRIGVIILLFVPRELKELVLH